MKASGKSLLIPLTVVVWMILAVGWACTRDHPVNRNTPPLPRNGNAPPPQPQKFDVAARFVASGWIGDGELGTKAIQFAESSNDHPHSPPTCIKVTYTPGSNGYAGIYWQNKPNNFGDLPGEDFRSAGYTKVTFWARGAAGGEVIECKAGGINSGKPYKDSFEATTGKITLEKDWKPYTINLEGLDLSSVIGGFCWVAAKSANPNGLTFYLDDIYYER